MLHTTCPEGGGGPLYDFCRQLRRGELAWLELMLDSGLDVNGRTADGRTPLMWAAVGGNVDAVRLLLDRGADVTAICPQGETALMRAASYGHTGTAQLLIAYGAEVNAVTVNGTTALMHACHALDAIGTVRLLVAAGADPEIRDQEGLTAADWAGSHPDAEAVLNFLSGCLD